MTMVSVRSAVGFWIASCVDSQATERGIAACDRALAYFPWLKTERFSHGSTEIQLWSHHAPEEATYVDDAGNLYLLVGSPIANVSWEQALGALDKAGDGAFELPWEGRCVLVRISSDGNAWTMWNDWTGSVPVFHTQLGKGRVTSTLEPAVVDAAGFTPDDFFLPGLVSLLVNGHYLGDWTLFEGMRVVPPDCMAQWNGAEFECNRLWTVEPSDERWERDWDELVDEMYELSHRAIADTLTTQPEWILPLSGGLDSRLIAAVGKDIGASMHAFTYGPGFHSTNTFYACRVAEALGLACERVEVGEDHLAKYAPMWADWFGSALHFHGMYQIPFLEAVRNVEAPIIMGYIGDALTGSQLVKLMSDEHTSLLDRMVSKWRLWRPEEIGALVRFDANSAMERIEAELLSQYHEVPGSAFQRVWLLFWWNHIFGFSYYQPMMYDYWKGVATPYLDRNYARFCFSLPRTALEDRCLQKEMFRRFYPRLATIGGTYGPPINLGPGYVLRRLLAMRLPAGLRRGPLREFATVPGSIINQISLQACGERAVWPLNAGRASLRRWFDMDALESVYARAVNGEEKAHFKLRAVQAITLRAGL